jgi:hypothetical protein
MSHTTQKPERRAPPDNLSHFHDEELHHPAFGCVMVNNWSCGGAGMRLFGSDLSHHGGVSLAFYNAHQTRGLSNDRHAQGTLLLKVDLSQSQWARLVASSGKGDGVPVTISYKRVGPLEEAPMIAAPEASKKEVHGEEMAAALRERMDEMQRLAQRLGDMIDGGRIGKRELAGIQKEIARHAEQLPGTVQFIYDQFARATEHVVEDAKTEIEAHVDAVATRIGYEALRNAAPQYAALTRDKQSN